MQAVNAQIEKATYAYKFSIVMAVYNVAPFLEEAVDSILQQTIGFRENVQLILVDDGSNDSSGVICDEYKKQYSENIIVIHKENGGVSSARNEGLKYVRGRYVNFMDSDDKISKNTLEEVYKFFVEHDREIDVVSIPMYFFDGQTGGHILNYKFKDGSRVIDLQEEYTCIQLSLATAFVKNQSLKSYKFDIKLKYAEDAKLAILLLIKKMALGVVSSACYLYRKRSIGETSAIQNSLGRREWYNDSLNYFTENVMCILEKKLGYIPYFVQYSLMYDLQWKLKQEKLPAGILSPTEKDMYYRLMFQLISKFDDKIILEQKNLPIEYKAFLLRKKYKKFPESIYCDEDISLYFDNTYVTSFSKHKFVIDFITLEEELLTIEGYGVYIPFGEQHDVQIIVSINGKLHPCEFIARDKNKYINGEAVLNSIGFRCVISTKNLEKKNRMYMYMQMDGMLVKKTKLSWGSFSPITSLYKHQYCIKDGWKFTAQEDSIQICKVKRKLEGVISEICFIKELLMKKEKSDRKAGLARILYQSLRWFERKEIWLLSDRVNKADDNGEALFLYLQNKKNIKSYFSIGKDAPDKEYLKKIGRIVEHNSFRYKIVHLLSSNIVSSQADHFTTNPFVGYSDPYRDILARQKFIFLQHGIIKDDLSGWLNKYNKNIDMFVTAAKPEYKSILRYDYGYSDQVVKLTGIPRHDRLYHDEKNIITIIPTWRAALVTGLDSNTGLRNVKNGFETSNYNRMYSGLLSNEKLIQAAQKYNYQIQFLPHPNMLATMPYMKISPIVKVLDLKTEYRKIFAESNLLITDYSSVAFDFSYLRKPVLYFQKDKEEFFATHTYTQGYFDYERDGFGEVYYDIETLVNAIIEYMKNNCQLKDLYRERINDFFAYHDKNNCQRVYEEILKL